MEGGTDCCLWDGVICDDITGQVIYLDLSCSYLYGTFPSNSSLFQLKHLRRLDFSGNDFKESKIPSGFGRFTSLIYLDLSGCKFSGTVPYEISYLSKLVSLDLSSNSLKLENSTLTGIIQNLTELRTIDLSGIGMSSGELPESISNLKSLHDLDLSNCNLSGTIPSSMGNLSQLWYLNLAYNNLRGTIPSSLSDFTELAYLCINNNQLEGSIPDNHNAFPNLLHLGLSDNSLSGTTPSWIYSHPFLYSLKLSYNQFIGHIQEFHPYSVLQHLDLRNNSFEGSIPRSM